MSLEFRGLNEQLFGILNYRKQRWKMTNGCFVNCSFSCIVLKCRMARIRFRRAVTLNVLSDYL